MSSIPQSTKNENEISDFVSKFIAKFHLGKLLFQCNAGKVKTSCYGCFSLSAMPRLFRQKYVYAAENRGV